jgi:hypothetical protein
MIYRFLHKVSKRSFFLEKRTRFFLQKNEICKVVSIQNQKRTVTVETLSFHYFCIFEFAMPKTSKRQALIKEFDRLLMFLILDDEDDSEDFEEIIELRNLVTENRYMDLRTTIPKNRSMNEMLWHFPERDFKQIVRMDKISFVQLVQLIQNNPVFSTNERIIKKQSPVWIQLYVVLQRLGCDGNGISVGRSARYSGISDGCVCKFTERVFKALLDLKDE